MGLKVACHEKNLVLSELAKKKKDSGTKGVVTAAAGSCWANALNQLGSGVVIYMSSRGQLGRAAEPLVAKEKNSLLDAKRLQ
jgi:hypothetical protein